MRGSGPREERETIINFNEADSLATIWTASETVYRRLKKRGWSPSIDEERHAEFRVPKGRVRLPTVGSDKPRKPTQPEWLKGVRSAKVVK